MKTAIEVGHGGKDPGAAANGFRESDINLCVSIELKRQLERHGAEVLISRTADVDDKAADFLPKVKDFNPDLGISVHFNAGGGKGFECFYQDNFQAYSYKICELIEQEVKLLGQNSRGLKPSKFLMSNGSNCVWAYTEGGFIDNVKDLELFNTPEKQRKFGAAYAKGILKYFNKKWADDHPEKSETFRGPREETDLKLYRVQVGAFSDRKNAEDFVEKLEEMGVHGAFVV
jgi:N-acetylmuramoyl-L-alanine amidase